MKIHTYTEPWIVEVNKFYEILSKLDESMEEKAPTGATEEQLLQGPFSDSMAHIGQLLMLRRIAGAPVPSENFLFGDIIGVLGLDQPDSVAPDE